MAKVKNLCRRVLATFLSMALTVPLFSVSVSAGVPASDVSFSVTDLKVTSSPVEEENDFTVQATYHASVTNHGWSSSVWHQCGSCGGAGAVRRYATSGSSAGGGTNKVTLTCGQSFEGRTWKCRDACDGRDYFNQYEQKGTVTHNTKNPWDNDHTNSWEDGGQYIWDKKNTISCVCTMEVAVGDKPANSGMIPCRGCGGIGNIYVGTADCSSCDSKTQSSCTNCGGTGDVKVFEACMECSGAGQVTEFITCGSCGGSGGQYVTVSYPPVEPPSSISTKVTIALEGKVIETKDITFNLATTTSNSSVWTKEGDVTVDWVINAGEGIGDKTVTTDINGGEDSKSIIVKVEPACNLTVEFVPPNAPYRSDTDVISTFQVKNHNSELGLDIRPKHKLKARLTVKDGAGKLIATVDKDDVVIPKGVSNIVYFKWRTPKDYDGVVTMQCAVNVGYQQNKVGVNEDNLDDNISSVTRDIVLYDVQETPDTQFEERAPAWFKSPVSTDNVDTSRFTDSVLNKASFSEWTYAGDSYKLQTYNVGVDAKTKLEPDVNSPSHKLVGEVYEMKSGYGISSKVTPTISSNAPASSVTSVQNSTMHVPEYRFGSGNSKFRTLELFDGAFTFRQNVNAKNNKGKVDNRRIHFTPLYYPDGEYQCRSYLFDLWTPAGMLSVISQDSVTINGDMYDDWYLSQTKPNF